MSASKTSPTSPGVARTWYWVWGLVPLIVSSCTGWAILVEMPARHGELAHVYADFTNTSVTRILVYSAVSLTFTAGFTLVLFRRACGGRVLRPMAATLWQFGVSAFSWVGVWVTMSYALLQVSGEEGALRPSMVAFWIMILAGIVLVGMIVSMAIRRASLQ